jgi:hypothetical protein
VGSDADVHVISDAFVSYCGHSVCDTALIILFGLFRHPKTVKTDIFVYPLV